MQMCLNSDETMAGTVGPVGPEWDCWPTVFTHRGSISVFAGAKLWESKERTAGKHEKEFCKIKAGPIWRRRL